MELTRTGRAPAEGRCGGGPRGPQARPGRAGAGAGAVDAARTLPPLIQDDAPLRAENGIPGPTERGRRPSPHRPRPPLTGRALPVGRPGEARAAPGSTSGGRCVLASLALRTRRPPQKMRTLYATRPTHLHSAPQPFQRGARARPVHSGLVHLSLESSTSAPRRETPPARPRPTETCPRRSGRAHGPGGRSHWGGRGCWRRGVPGVPHGTAAGERTCLSPETAGRRVSSGLEHHFRAFAVATLSQSSVLIVQRHKVRAVCAVSAVAESVTWRNNPEYLWNWSDGDKESREKTSAFKFDAKGVWVYNTVAK